MIERSGNIPLVSNRSKGINALPEQLLSLAIIPLLLGIQAKTGQSETRLPLISYLPANG
jgi:hypothetical protein